MVPFSEEELKVVGEHIGTTSFGSRFSFKIPKYNTPITPRENIALCVKREKPLWFPSSMDFCNLESRTNIDHIARAEVMDMGPPYADEEKGGKDLFGIEWVYVPTVGGSMVKPGNPTLLDVNDWPEIIKFPDIDALDWDECKRLNSVLNETTRSFHVTFQNGIFERLISFMDFEGAAMALIDEEQQDAVHALFSKLSDMYISMIDHYLEFLNLDGVVFHDDWGSQRAPFFSLNTLREMILPYLKRVVESVHKRGMKFELHSCGKNEMLVPGMIEAGVDTWSGQPMNDFEMLYEKYGDKIVLGMPITGLKPDMSDSELRDTIQAFVEKHPHALGSTFSAPPKATEFLYEISRKVYCGE